MATYRGFSEISGESLAESVEGDTLHEGSLSGNEDSSPDSCLSIAVIEPHEIMRRGLEAMLPIASPGAEVWCFADPRDAVREIRRSLFDFVLAPGDLDDDIWAELRPLLSERPTRLLVLLWSAEADDLAEASRLPADGFLLAGDLTIDRLSESLQAAVRGDLPLPRAFARQLLAQARNAPRGHHPFGPPALTPRERQALELLGQGLSNKQIARRLGITQHGAKRHVANLLAKLNCSNRTLAVAFAMRAGLLDGPPAAGGPTS